MKNYKTIIAMVAAGLACSAVTSKAVLTTSLISAGTSDTSLSGTSYSVSGGATLLDTVKSQYTSGSGDMGTLTTFVYGNDANNSLDGLTFIYEDVLTAGKIASITIDGFSAPVEFANYSGSTLISGSVNYDSTGFLKFIVAPNDADISSPQTVSYAVLTSLPGFANNIGSVQDGQTAGNLQVAVPVPEASTVMAGALMLLPFGIGVIRSLRKERAV